MDTVVTDKKGVYIHDLTPKNFHVFEDGKEQAIKSFSFEADPAAPTNSHPHYMVLFFDNSSTDLAYQMQARQAAGKFIDTSTGPNCLMAIVNFGGTLSVAQDFTSDANRLKRRSYPLIVNHMQIVPSASNQFKKTDMAVLYVEVYEPLLKTEKPPGVAVRYRVLDRKSGTVRLDSGLMNVAPSIHPGDPVIPVGLKLVTDNLEPGEYRLELEAKDSAGGSSPVRTTDFQVE